jgi:hypothetical protein
LLTETLKREAREAILAGELGQKETEKEIARTPLREHHLKAEGTLIPIITDKVTVG